MADSLGRVLIVGKDREAMEVQRSILEHFWPVSLWPVDRWMEEKPNGDVVVLCTSIPALEQQAWIDRIRQQSPQILLVRMNGFNSGPRGGADATVNEDHGPGDLVSTIYELLTERGLASRGWPIPGDLSRLH